MSLPRMRTAEKILNIIKAQDPDTEVTLHYIRDLIKSGKIPVTLVGRKKLVDADRVIAYIAAGEPASVEDDPEEPVERIRRVEV